MEGNNESSDLMQQEHHLPDDREYNEKRQREEGKEPLPYAVPLSILMAGVIIAGAIMFTGRNGAEVSNKKLSAQADNSVGVAGDYKSLEAHAPMLGNPDAPVAIVEFADFQCPFCGRFYQTAAKEIINSYVKTGKAKLIYHDFAFLGEESNWAAEAARCAGDQGKYWQYHDYLFEHQSGENKGAFTKDRLKSFALEIGLNRSDFNTCLDSGTHARDVENDTALGKKFGVSGTPTSFVNGKLVQGAVPFATFQPIIEEALKGK